MIFKTIFWKSRQFFSTSAEVDLFDKNFIYTLPLLKTYASLLLFTAIEDSFKRALEDICISGDSCGRVIVLLIDDTGRRCVVHLILNFPSPTPVKTFYS